MGVAPSAFDGLCLRMLFFVMGAVPNTQLHHIIEKESCQEIFRRKKALRNHNAQADDKVAFCIAFSKIYKDEVALASLREGGGPP